MIASPPSTADAKLLLRGLHLDLNDTTKAWAETKAQTLFRHEPRIVRLRIDVEPDVRSRTRMFTAKARVELHGPDLSASVTTTAPQAAITLLIDKLHRMLRKRATNLRRHRTSGDIRAYVT